MPQTSSSSTSGGIIGFLIFILAIVGLLMTSWYAGSSNASLDSSFGDHCAVTTEGSSAPGGISNSSFDSSNAEKCDDARTNPREGFKCKTLAGRGAGAFQTSFMGAGAQVASTSKKFADQARECGVSYYQKRPSKSGYVAAGNMNGQVQFSDAIKQEIANRKNSVSKMVDMSRAPANVQKAMKAQQNGPMSTAGSKMFGAGTLGALVPEQCRDSMSEAELNVPIQYQYSGEGQMQLYNSPFNVSRKTGANPASMLSWAAAEPYVRNGIAATRSSVSPNQRAQISLDMVSDARLQRGLDGARPTLDRIANGNFVSGDSEVMSTIGGQATTSPFFASGGAGLAQWPQTTNGTWNQRCPSPVNVFGKKKADEGFRSANVKCDPCNSPALYPGLAKRRMNSSLAIMTGLTGGGNGCQ